MLLWEKSADYSSRGQGKIDCLAKCLTADTTGRPHSFLPRSFLHSSSYPAFCGLSSHIHRSQVHDPSIWLCDLTDRKASQLNSPKTKALIFLIISVTFLQFQRTGLPCVWTNARNAQASWGLWIQGLGAQKLKERPAFPSWQWAVILAQAVLWNHKPVLISKHLLLAMDSKLPKLIFILMLHWHSYIQWIRLWKQYE